MFIRLILSFAALVIIFFSINQRVFAQDSSRTIDDDFARVATKVPEFGGLFVDERGIDPGLGPLEGSTTILYVYLTNVSKKNEVEVAIKEVFGERLSWNELRVLQGQYGFLELKGWYDEASRKILSLPGIVSTDIDESQNRLSFGIECENIRSSVQNELNKAGVPSGAVVIKIVEPIELEGSGRKLVSGFQSPCGVFDSAIKSPWAWGGLGLLALAGLAFLLKKKISVS